MCFLYVNSKNFSVLFLIVYVNKSLTLLNHLPDIYNKIFKSIINIIVIMMKNVLIYTN